MKIKIDNRDLNFTIDTYGTFTLENEYEYEQSALMEEDDTLTFDNFDDRYESEYDMPGYVKHLAECSIDILKEELTPAGRYAETDEIVKDIKLLKTGSPQFYNYTTDWYVAEWDINVKNLKKYCAVEAFEKFRAEYWADTWKLDETMADGTPNLSYDPEYIIVAMLDWYTREIIDDETYMNEMYEKQNGYEYIQFKETNKSEAK